MESQSQSQSDSKQLASLCKQLGVKSSRLKRDNRTMIKKMSPNLLSRSIFDRVEQIKDKDPHLTSLLGIWKERHLNEQIAKRQISVYIYLSIKKQNLIFPENFEDFCSKFKSMYEEILLLFYGQTKYPFDQEYSFLNPPKKYNIIQLIRKEIRATVWELRSHSIAELPSVDSPLKEDITEETTPEKDLIIDSIPRPPTPTDLHLAQSTPSPKGKTSPKEKKLSNNVLKTIRK